MKEFLPNLLFVSCSVGLALCLACNSSNKVALFDPVKARSVVLYDIDPKRVQDYSKSLTNVVSYQLKSEEVQALFAQTKQEALNIWKGAFLAVVRCEDGKEYHLAISYFGGFARVLETGQDLKFDGGSELEYERIQTATLQNVFIAERLRKNRGTN